MGFATISHNWYIISIPGKSCISNIFTDHEELQQFPQDLKSMKYWLSQYIKKDKVEWLNPSSYSQKYLHRIEQYFINYHSGSFNYVFIKLSLSLSKYFPTRLWGFMESIADDPKKCWSSFSRYEYSFPALSAPTKYLILFDLGLSKGVSL